MHALSVCKDYAINFYLYLFATRSKLDFIYVKLFATRSYTWTTIFSYKFHDIFF